MTQATRSAPLDLAGARMKAKFTKTEAAATKLLSRLSPADAAALVNEGALAADVLPANWQQLPQLGSREVADARAAIEPTPQSVTAMATPVSAGGEDATLVRAAAGFMAGDPTDANTERAKKLLALAVGSGRAAKVWERARWQIAVAAIVISAGEAT